MSMDFRLSLRKELRNPLTSNWLTRENVWEKVKKWLSEYDLRESVQDIDIKKAEKYLDVVKLLGEYLVEVPDQTIARGFKVRVQWGVKLATDAAHDSKSLRVEKIVEIGRRCVAIVEEAVKRCGG